MNTDQIQAYVERYCQATRCTILEKSPTQMTVKLSPHADKLLTNRPYYWSFVERTGVEPETMTLSFVFDPSTMSPPSTAASTKQISPQAEQQDSILGRYLGISPAVMSVRQRHELLSFGSGRLRQIFQAARKHGQYTLMYEQPHQQDMSFFTGYTAWFCLNIKIEFVCDMKRDELHSIGISLSTGELVEQFFERIQPLQLTPQIPANTHVRETISLFRAAKEIEKHIEQKIRSYDHHWAEQADVRFQAEQQRIREYYAHVLESCSEEEKMSIEQQFDQRLKEIEWQHQPRIRASVINCGVFQLFADTFRQINF